jgi:hypothetical protein
MPFQDALVVEHRGSKPLFSKEFVAAAAGVECGGVVAGDPFPQPVQLTLVGLVGALPVLGVAGLGALQLPPGLPPGTGAAEFALEVGGVAGQLSDLGVGAFLEGAVGSGRGLELLAAAGLPPAGAFGLELLARGSLGRVPSLGARDLPAAFDLFERALAFRVDPQPRLPQFVVTRR